MPTESAPAAVLAFFDATPTAQTVRVEMGHGYGKAKYSGTCRITGNAILPSTTVRKVVFWTRDGRKFDGYLPSGTVAALDFRGVQRTIESLDAGTDLGIEGVSEWVVGSASLGSLQGLDLASLPDGTRIEVLRYVEGAYAPTVDAWTVRVFGEKRLWHSGTGRITDKQLASGFARTKRIAGFRVTVPLTFRPLASF